eukprot:SAG22_NODE_1504_length_4277_cov_4.550503_4_plen_588_part_01
MVALALGALQAALVAAGAAAATPGRRRPRVVGWYGDADGQGIKNVPLEALNLGAYTHIVAEGGPSILANGTAVCGADCCGNRDGGLGEALRNRTGAAGVKLQWLLSTEPDIARLIRAPDGAAQRAAFIASIVPEFERCGGDGVEFDWEGPSGNGEAGTYTEFLIDLQLAAGPQRDISADVQGDVSSGGVPYVTANYTTKGGRTLAEAGAMGLFINVMSYFWSDTGDLSKYTAVAQGYRNFGWDLAMVNLGIPYYCTNEGAWGEVEASCPDAPPASNTCGGTLYIGKQMNFALGQLVQQEGFGGAFPWMANYDTAHHNNSLVAWLDKGLRQPAPLLPPPAPAPAVPFYLGGYIYGTRAAALSACEAHKFPRLCTKAELKGHQDCNLGWCSDWEGYWMAEAAKGCGGKGYNEGSGVAGAYCCKGAGKPRNWTETTGIQWCSDGASPDWTPTPADAFGAGSDGGCPRAPAGWPLGKVVAACEKLCAPADACLGFTLYPAARDGGRAGRNLTECCFRTGGVQQKPKCTTAACQGTRCYQKIPDSPPGLAVVEDIEMLTVPLSALKTDESSRWKTVDKRDDRTIATGVGAPR